MNINIKNYFFLLNFVTLLLISCKKDQLISIPDFHRNYFPVNINHWIIYQVDSIYWNDFYPPQSPEFHDTNHYQIMEKIESTYFDGEGRKTYRLERYYRNNSDENWQIKDIWAVNLFPTNAQKIEENIRFVKLIFPIRKNAKWNGNLYNTLGNQEYKYIKIHEPFTINNFYFDSTIHVLQRADSSLIDCNYFMEIYAKNVGLIYKRMRHLETEIDGTINKGYDCTYKIIGWGSY